MGYIVLAKAYKTAYKMNVFKATFTGILEFGNSKTYEIMLRNVMQKIEVYYKNDVIIRPEIFFSEDDLNVKVHKHVVVCAEKSWKNTAGLLDCLAQFAIAGKLEAWFVNGEGKLLDYRLIEPLSEKTTVQEFKRGVALGKEGGKEDEAIEAYNKVIEKFERHAYAYERRGYVCFKLHRFDDAMLDFTKSINLYDNPDAHFGRANVKIVKGDIKGAIADLEIAIKLSLPLQPIFWLSRRVKGECHFKLNDWPAAIFELKFVVKRVFKPEDPNYAYRSRAWRSFGEALLKNGETAESVKAFNQAAAIEPSPKDTGRHEGNMVEEPRAIYKRAVGVA